MAEHDETSEKPPDEALEAANTQLQAAQKRRNAARDKLRAAEDDLEGDRWALSSLRAAEQRLQDRQTKNAAEAERIPDRLKATQQTVATLQAELQRIQNTRTPARLLARLLFKPARLTRQIRAAQQTVEDLQAKPQQLQKQQGEDADELEGLKSRIEETEREKAGKRRKVGECREELEKEARSVVEKASTVRKMASDEIMKQAQSLSPTSSTKLAGGASGGYVSVLVTNLSYNFAFYHIFGINIFSYSAQQDFAIPHVESLISANVFLGIFLIYRHLKKIENREDPKGTEDGAVYLYSRAKTLESWKGIILFLLPLFILSFIIFPAFVGGVAGGIAHKAALESKEKVSVITVSELKSLTGLVHIGSSSTHEFFLRKASDDANSRKNNNVIAIPVSGIVCIDDATSGCQSNETTDDQGNTQLQAILGELQKLSLKKENNLWISELTDALEENVIENAMPQAISQHMNCGEGRLEVSEFIRFERDGSALNQDSEGKASAFANKWKDQAIQWTVFGFASADGRPKRNADLSRNRAVAVKDVLCKALGCNADGPDIAVRALSEDHSINGVANSRSARIAVCVNDAPQQSRAETP